MRVISSFGLIASFIFFTDATAIEKRAVSAPVQACIKDVEVINTTFDFYAEKASIFNATLGYRGALDVHLYDNYVEKNITNNAIPHCCNSVVTAYTDEEASGIINSLSTLSGKVVNTMQIMASKQPEFAKLLLMNHLFTVDIKNLAGNTTILEKCLVQRTPTDKLADLTQYINQIDTAYGSAYLVFNKTATP